MTDRLHRGSRQAGGSNAVPLLTDLLLQTQYLGYLGGQGEEKKRGVTKDPKLIIVPRKLRI